MQGLARYDDSPPTSATAHAEDSATHLSRPEGNSTDSSRTAPAKRKASAIQSRDASPIRNPRDARLVGSSASGSNERPRVDRTSENLADTVQADLDMLDTVNGSPAKLTAKRRRAPSVSMFAEMTHPPALPGLENWGIPDAMDPGHCSPQLKAKVEHFLNLKAKQNQHINTSLLASSTFHNPHIYSKLVEFVDLDERQSLFPGGGWLTRANVEDEIEDYGPLRLSEAQKRKQGESRERQEAGKRSAIVFQAGRRDRVQEASAGADSNGRTGRPDDRRDQARDVRRERRGDRDGPKLDRRKDIAVSKHGDTLGFGRRDRDGGWDERDMTKEKPKYRYY